MPLEQYHHRDFPSALNWQAVSFMRVEWPDILLEGHRLGIETYPAEYNPVHFAFVEANVLISYAALMTIELKHMDQTYRVAAVGNVFTFPAFRGEGYGSRVVAAAVAYLQQQAVDVGMLFCKPHLLAFYRANGWELLEGSETRQGTSEQFTVHLYHRLMHFVSERGQLARTDFATQPVYIPWPW
jgi:GNAT superfamily N-acetyltransferase